MSTIGRGLIVVGRQEQSTRKLEEIAKSLPPGNAINDGARSTLRGIAAWAYLDRIFHNRKWTVHLFTRGGTRRR